MSKKKNPLDFEASLSNLEAMIHKMENQQLSLEDALKCFEEGVGLIQACQKSLEDAEQKIKTITSQISLHST